MAFGPITSTATPEPVVSFTPQKNYLSFSGVINQYIAPTTYTGTSNTLVPTDVLAGLLILTNGSAIAATMPSAAALVPQIEGARGGLVGVAPVGTNGNAIYFDVKAGGAGAVTVTAGTGGTLVGSGAITAGNVKRFLLVVTNSGTTPTYTLYSLGQSAA